MISLQHFMAMGGYALYVWPAYGLALAVLSYNAINAIISHKQIKRRLQRAMVPAKP